MSNKGSVYCCCIELKSNIGKAIEKRTELESKSGVHLLFTKCNMWDFKTTEWKFYRRIGRKRGKEDLNLFCSCFLYLKFGMEKEYYFSGPCIVLSMQWENYCLREDLNTILLTTFTHVHNEIFRWATLSFFVPRNIHKVVGTRTGNSLWIEKNERYKRIEYTHIHTHTNTWHVLSM